MTDTNYVPTFTSSASALRTLRAGKRNPNWRYAADYLMERAAPDVLLLVEAATEIELEKIAPNATSKTKIRNKAWYAQPLTWLIIIASLACIAGVVYYLMQNFTLRFC